MRLIKPIFVFALLLLTTCQIFSQTKTVTDAGNKSVVLDEKNPAVYLEFVKTGDCYNGNYHTVIRVDPCEKKSELDEKFDAAWIRYVNNTRWAILVDIQKISVSPAMKDGQLSNGLQTSIAKDGAELDVIYDIESETGCDFHEDAPKGQTCKRRETPVPDYYRRAVSGVVFIPSGQSIVFAVNREHLKKYLTIYVLYNFEWEMSDKISLPPARYDTQHRVYFSWFDLEEGIKKSVEKKTR